MEPSSCSEPICARCGRTRASWPAPRGLASPIIGRRAAIGPISARTPTCATIAAPKLCACHGTRLPRRPGWADAAPLPPAGVAGAGQRLHLFLGLGAGGAHLFDAGLLPGAEGALVLGEARSPVDAIAQRDAARDHVERLDRGILAGDRRLQLLEEGEPAALR